MTQVVWAVTLGRNELWGWTFFGCQEDRWPDVVVAGSVMMGREGGGRPGCFYLLATYFERGIWPEAERGTYPCPRRMTACDWHTTGATVKVPTGKDQVRTEHPPGGLPSPPAAARPRNTRSTGKGARYDGKLWALPSPVPRVFAGSPTCSEMREARLAASHAMLWSHHEAERQFRH